MPNCTYRLILNHNVHVNLFSAQEYVESLEGCEGLADRLARTSQQEQGQVLRMVFFLSRLTLETSASESLYSCQFTLSTQLIKPNYLAILPTDAAPQFLEKLYSLFILYSWYKNAKVISLRHKRTPFIHLYLSINIVLVKPSQILSCCGSGCNGLV